ADEKLASNENFTVTNHSKSSKNQLILETNSLYDNVSLYVEYFDRDATVQSKQFSIKKGSQLIKIPLANSTENETISYNWFFLKEQQLYSNSGSYTIEQDKKNEEEQWLVEWQSWNDKLNPAQQYQWKLLLKNYKTNKAFQGEFLASMYDASLDLLLENEWGSSWRTNSEKINNYVYVNFSSPRKPNTVQYNYLYGSNFYRGIDFYWNTWNYYSYHFSNQNYYNDYYQYIPEEIQNNTGTYFQVEVRDAKTGAFISNAMIFNFKTAEQVETNEDGFTKILGEKTVLMGVVALGYEEQRLELKKGLTVVHLQPKEDGISETSYDDLFKVKKAWYGIYYYYLNNVTDASKSVQAEIRFTEGVIKNDDEIIEILNYMDVDGVYENLEMNEIVVDTYRTTSKPKSNVAASTVTSRTIEGRPNASFIQNLQGKVPDLSISTGSEEPGSGTTVILRGIVSIDDTSKKPLVILDGVPVSEAQLSLLQSDIYDVTVLKDTEAIEIYGNRGANGVIVITTNKAQQAAEHLEIPLRKDLKETASFYLHLQRNDRGEVVIDFTAPEALTKWKFRGLAHNKSTDYIYIETLSRTQKEVMIQPNMPRFVRETDEVVLKARVSNTTAQPLNATAMLRLFNTITGEDLSAQIIKTEVLVPVTIEGLSANTVSWTVEIPKNIEGLQYRISVQSGNFTDGEESVIPVLGNRQLVTETVPIWQLANENKT